jgi:hypothetical protein
MRAAPDARHGPSVPPEAILQFRIDRALECLTGNLVGARDAIDQLLVELADAEAPRYPPVQVRDAPTSAVTVPARSEHQAVVATPRRRALRQWRHHLPHPWIVAGIAAATTALQSIFDALASGRVAVPSPGIHALAIALLPIVIRALRAIPNETDINTKEVGTDHGRVQQLS